MEGRVSILVSILLALLELGLLLSLDIGNGEDQANATKHCQSIKLYAKVQAHALFVAELAGERDLIQSRAILDLYATSVMMLNATYTVDSKT